MDYIIIKLNYTTLPSLTCGSTEILRLEEAASIPAGQEVHRDTINHCDALQQYEDHQQLVERCVQL